MEKNEDFTMEPAAEDRTISINIPSGAEGISFQLTKLKDVIEGSGKSLSFEIQSVDLADGTSQGNTTTEVTFEETAALGGAFSPEIDGPNEPNQVYFDLSAQNETTVNRETWDLGFYNGDEDRVILNGSVNMATAELTETDIDAISPENVSDLQDFVKVGTFDPTNAADVDNPTGELSGTAIEKISATDSENKVYLVNLGSKIGTKIPAAGTQAVAGESRGWMKIRVLKSHDGYTLQQGTIGCYFSSRSEYFKRFKF